jgi:autotransporter-associated beta strand protein
VTPVTHEFGNLGAGAGSVTLERNGSAPVLAKFQTFSQNLPGTVIRGDWLGEPTDGPFTRLTFANVPVLSGGLIPGVYAEDAAAGGRTSLAAYDSTVDAAGAVGVRALRDAEMVSGSVVANPSNAGETPLDANVLVQGTVTATAQVNGVNSLTFSSGSRFALAANQTLNVGKPGIFVRGHGLGAKITGGTVDFGSARGLVYTDGDLSLSGGISGTAGLTKLGPGKLTVGAIQSLTGGVVVAAGTLLMNTAVNETNTISVSAGATLRGEGSAGLASVSGRLDPGDGVGVLDLTGLTMNSGSELAIELGSATSYDQVRVGAGGVSLGGLPKLTLTLLNAYNPADWQDSFMIVRNDSRGSISGFVGDGVRFLLEGNTFSVGTQDFRISYVGGDGNDAVLTAVPEPGASWLVLGAMAFLGAFRRWRVLRR